GVRGGGMQLGSEPGSGIPKADLAGVRLQVSTMYPFMPARSVKQAEEQPIAGLATDIAPFDFTLTHLDTFPGVHYLPREPVALLVAITRPSRSLALLIATS